MSSVLPAKKNGQKAKAAGKNNTLQWQTRLDEANANTQALVKLMEALASANSAEEAATVALETVKSEFGWAYGSYWK